MNLTAAVSCWWFGPVPGSKDLCDGLLMQAEAHTQTVGTSHSHCSPTTLFSRQKGLTESASHFSHMHIFKLLSFMKDHESYWNKPRDLLHRVMSKGLVLVVLVMVTCSSGVWEVWRCGCFYRPCKSFYGSYCFCGFFLVFFLPSFSTNWRGQWQQQSSFDGLSLSFNAFMPSLIWSMCELETPLSLSP